MKTDDPGDRNDNEQIEKLLGDSVATMTALRRPSE
jgi:hypothetical protein